MSGRREVRQAQWAGSDSPVRELLPGLGSGVATHVPFPGNPPLFVTPIAETLATDAHAAVAWFAEHAEVFEDLLAHYGAFVLRGFPIEGTDGFADLVGHYPPHTLGYSGGATPRDQLGRNVYEATQVPAAVDIKLHQEMAYLKDYPAKLAFYCHIPADSGGETIIGDMRQFMAMLEDRFLSELEARRLTYHRNFRASDVPHGSDDHPEIYHATLRQGFFSDDRQQIEADCWRLGMEFEWMPDGSLSTRLHKEAFATHPRRGDRVYFNHILTQIMDPGWLGPGYDAYLDLYDRANRPRPYHVTYGDGSAINEADYRAVADGLSKVVVSFPWRRGDVMVIDNIYTAHGRNPYTGHRDVQVALLA
jgi:alpha-ketoglutarate-dependent taurine dioxygenase